ncbi:MAG: hypothetical protein HY711_06620, partial [Candidatus Melainabacteria bacterium]|nr:hypothetical protein [Candidatus Melainabacteria bacterium]
MSRINNTCRPTNYLSQLTIYMLVIQIPLMMELYYLPTSPCLARPPNKQLTTRINQIYLELNKTANRQLSQSMETTASWLSLFARRLGHFPSSPKELLFAKTQLLRHMPANPYHQTNNQSNKINADEDPIQIEIKIYPQLSDGLIQQIHESPPDDWQESPGTITVLTNGDRLVAIWGAGSNH